MTMWAPELHTLLYWSLATGGLSVALTRFHITGKLRKTWPDTTLLGKLFRCTFCMSHWIGALVVAGHLGWWPGLFPFLCTVFAVACLGTMLGSCAWEFMRMGDQMERSARATELIAKSMAMTAARKGKPDGQV